MDDLIRREPLELARAIDGLTEWQKHVQTDSNINRDITIAIEALKAQLGTNLAEVGMEVGMEEHAKTHACDCISRQAVKELAHNQVREKYCGMAFKEQRDFYIKLADSIIDLLPSAQPEIVRCKDCNHFYKDDLNQWCFLGKYGVKENDFCSRAERRTDDQRRSNQTI